MTFLSSKFLSEKDAFLPNNNSNRLVVFSTPTPESDFVFGVNCPVLIISISKPVSVYKVIIEILPPSGYLLIPCLMPFSTKV